VREVVSPARHQLGRIAERARIASPAHGEPALQLGRDRRLESGGRPRLSGRRRRQEEERESGGTKHGDLAGFFKLVARNDRVIRLFELTNLDRVFVMHRNVEEALALGGDGDKIPRVA
jgi:hypothetical protein